MTIISIPGLGARYADQQVRVSRVLGDDHYKWMSRVTIDVAC